jgi:UDP:flavonoid glycosyltransferase YjiC (YdhE family)
MRLLFTTWAWPSHYNAMVPLAWALRAAGHEVRMTSQPALLPAMRSSGLPITPVGADVDMTAAYRGGTARVPAGAVTADHAYQSFLAAATTVKPSRESRLAVYGAVAAAMTDDLLTLARNWRADLVVFDPLTFAGPLVAKLSGVPAVRSLFGPDITYFTKVTAAVRPWAELLARYGLDVDDVDLLGTATIDPCPPALQVPDAPTRRIHTRYVPYNGIAAIPFGLPAASSPGRPRICLTWGTSTNQRVGRSGFLPDEVLRGAVKLAAERDAELVLAITTGQRELLPDLPTGVTVMESVPLDALLPLCEAVIHQGGAGTMLTALCHGLPQLTVTHFVDQAANAVRLAAAGAGRTFAVTEVTAADLVAAGHHLLDDPAHRASARRLRAEIEAQPSPVDIVPQLLDLTPRR